MGKSVPSRLFGKGMRRPPAPRPGRAGAAWLRAAGAALLLAALAACGFQLRGTTPLPFETLYVGISDNSRFGADLRRAIKAVSPGTRIVEEPEGAQARLQQLEQRRERREVSLNAQGRVEEYELSIHFRFRLIDSVGHELIPDTLLVASRDMQYDAQVVQAKEGEMATLYRDMQRSLVDRIVRRLTAPDVREAAERAAAARSGTGPELPIVPGGSEPQPSVPDDWADPDLDTPGAASGPGGLGL